MQSRERFVKLILRYKCRRDEDFVMRFVALAKYTKRDERVRTRRINEQGLHSSNKGILVRTQSTRWLSEKKTRLRS